MVYCKIIIGLLQVQKKRETSEFKSQSAVCSHYFAVYGRHGKYVTMRSSYFANFERSCCELRAKLLRTSSKAVLRTSSEVVVNVERTSSKIIVKLERTSSEVTRLCVAKELHALRTGVYVALEVKRNQLISWRVQHGKIQRVRTTEDCFSLA